MTAHNLEGRLLSRAELAPDSDCLLWTGYRDKAGWGRIKFAGEVWLVHRAMWLATFGEIPEGESVLHSCHVQHCINSDHLFLGTPADRIYHMLAAGRRRSGAGSYTPRKGKTVRRWGKKPVAPNEMYIANKVERRCETGCHSGISSPRVPSELLCLFAQACRVAVPTSAQPDAYSTTASVDETEEQGFDGNPSKDPKPP